MQGVNTQNKKHDIQEDFKTDREEFYKESNKEELLKTLHDQYKKSAKGKWNMLQKLFALGHFSSQQHSPKHQSHVILESTNHYQGHEKMTLNAASQNQEATHLVFDSNNHRQRPPSPSLNRKTVITVQYSKDHKKQNGFHSLNQSGEIPVRPASKVKFSSG